MTRIVLWIAQLPVVAGAILLWPAIDWVGFSRLATTICVLVGVGTALVSFSLTRRAVWLVPSTIFLGMLLLFGVVDFSPVQPATRAVRRIKPGLPESEVRAILREEFPARGRFHPPGLERPVQNGWLNFVLDPGDGDYDAAAVMIQFEHGHVVSAAFLPD